MDKNERKTHLFHFHTNYAVGMYALLHYWKLLVSACDLKGKCKNIKEMENNNNNNNIYNYIQR